MPLYYILIFVAIFVIVKILTGRNKRKKKKTERKQKIPKKYIYEKALLSDDENDLLDLINEYLKAQGSLILKAGAFESKLAEDHVNYMIAQGEVSHDNFDERVAVLMNKNALSVSENVGYGYRSSKAALKAWLKSPGHKRVLDSKSNIGGIAIKKDSFGRKYYATIHVKTNS